MGDQKGEIERGQAERGVELVAAREGARLAEALAQHGADAVVHQRLDLTAGQCGQHVIPPSTTSVWPVMKEACSELKKNTAFATSSTRARRPSGVRRAMRAFCSSAMPLTMSLSK